MGRTNLRPGEKKTKAKEVVERDVDKKKKKATQSKSSLGKQKATTRKKKSKEVVIEEYGSEERDISESEPESPPPLAVKEKQLKPSKKKPTYSQLLQRLKKIKFAPTRYPDHEFLHNAGLLEDMQTIFTTLGLGQFFNMAFPTYVEPTREFLASLSVTYYEDEMVEEANDLGHFEFKVQGKHYKMTFGEL
ncbi:PREDICTED: uncharacterized protein LOC104707135 [Camelina sativa]|uniref:Uncharacterized protein LOC104707135 n=1 Tax=Camelina sativa TaxID=90675 RepID=A0ABM0T6R3_CAMSA|nr:PREDICTED: uncharacterized protein LOC104707135 [Camelina sativa]